MFTIKSYLLQIVAIHFQSLYVSEIVFVACVTGGVPVSGWDIIAGWHGNITTGDACTCKGVVRQVCPQWKQRVYLSLYLDRKVGFGWDGLLQVL